LEIVGKSWKITFFHTKLQRTPIGWKELKERQYSFSLKSNQPVLDRMLTLKLVLLNSSLFVGIGIQLASLTGT
jgi:hypothetical protein